MIFESLPGARCSAVVVLMTLVAFTGVAAAQDPSAAADAPPSLSVVYYPSTDLVSIESHDTPLRRILSDISRPVFFTVHLLEPIPNELVSVEIDQLPLKDALRQLLGETGFTIAYLSGVDVVSAVLRNEPGEVSQTAAALKQVGSDAERAWVVESLFVLATDQYSSTRSAAVRALQILAPEQAVNPLIAMLDADDEQVRLTAAAELAALGDERAVDPLIAMLDSDDRQVRLTAAAKLAALGNERAVDPLGRAFNDPDPVVRDAVASSLAQLGGEQAISLLLAVFADGRTALHETVAIALAFEGDDQAKVALAEGLIEGRIASEVLSDDLIQALMTLGKPGPR